MENRQPKASPAAETAMLIRRPVAQVFQAFIAEERTPPIETLWRCRP